MHPKPEETNNTKTTDANTDGDAINEEQNAVNVDTNLIQLEAEDTDDIIFEDFARLRLRGETEA
jgi:beta-arrestin